MNTPPTASRLASILLLGMLLSACKIYGDPCQKDISDCLRRCDKSGADEEPQHHDDSRSECERRCHKCGPEAATPQPSAPQPGKAPTPTGY